MSPLRPPRPPSVRDKSRPRAACSRRRGSSATAALRRVSRRRTREDPRSHVGQQPLGAGTGPARMPRPLCEARGSPTRPGPAAPGRAEPRRRLSRARFRASQFGRALRLTLSPFFPLLRGPRRPVAVSRSLSGPHFSNLFPSLSLNSWSPRVGSGASPAFSPGPRRPISFPRLPFSASPSPPFLTRPLRPAPLFLSWAQL